MVEQVFRLLGQNDLGYDYIESLNEVDYLYFTHRLNYKEMDYQVILAFDRENYSAFAREVFFAFPYMFSKRLYTKYQGSYSGQIRFIFLI